MKVYDFGTDPLILIGDIHGNFNALDSFISQVTDFFPEKMKGTFVLMGDIGVGFVPDAIEILATIAANYGQRILMIDGNHDNHVQLWRHVDRSPRRLTQIREDLFYCDRGATFVWDGRTFMTFGGAVSVDQYDRTPSVDWWDTEYYTEADIKAALEHASTVDVMLTHNIPFDALPVCLPTWNKPGFWPQDVLDLSNEYSRVLNMIVEKVRPELVVHGHMHRNYETVILDGVRVKGLSEFPTSDGFMYVVPPRNLDI